MKLIEIALVLVIFGIGLGIALLFNQSNVVRSDLNAQAQMLVAHLRQAQSESAAGRDGSAHGIHFEEDSYIVFEGGVFSAEDSANLEVTLPAAITIQNLSLNGGGTDIIFSAPAGDTDQFGTLELNSSANGQSRQVTINSPGIVSI